MSEDDRKTPERERPLPDPAPVPIPADGIGTRIRFAVEQLGSRAEASKIAGVSPETLRRHINEEASPTFEAIARIAVAAGVSLNWLATGQGDPRGTQEAAQAPSNKARRGVEPLQIRNAVILVERRLHKDPDLHSKARTIAEVAQELQYFHDQEWGTED